MKKIYAIAAFVLIAATSFGQRQFDFILALSTPVDGSTVPQSTSQQVSFTIQHTGDDLVVNDTLYLYYYNFTTDESYSLTGVAGSVSQLVLDAQVAAALNSNTAIPSSTFNGGNQLTLNTTATGFNVGDEILVVAEIGAFTPGSDTDPTNNFGSFTLSPVVSVTNLDATSFSAYPNPAVSELNVTANEQVVSLSIINLEGKVVATSASNKVDVSTLTSGVYLYEATTVSGLKAINKFVKQ